MDGQLILLFLIKVVVVIYFLAVQFPNLQITPSQVILVLL
jgi:hypothetical protein